MREQDLVKACEISGQKITLLGNLERLDYANKVAIRDNGADIKNEIGVAAGRVIAAALPFLAREDLAVLSTAVRESCEIALAEANRRLAAIGVGEPRFRYPLESLDMAAAQSSRTTAS
jgi:hypothetical protein